MNKVAKGAILVLMAGTVLTGCSKNRMVRGYYFDPMLSSEILPAVDNQQSVAMTLGSPTAIGAWDDQTWYYISTQLRYRPIKRAERMSRRIMAIHFDEGGNVDNVSNLDLSSAWHIKPSKEKTRTRGKELNLLQQLFMNVGRFAGAGQPGGNPNGPGPNGS